MPDDDADPGLAALPAAAAVGPYWDGRWPMIGPPRSDEDMGTHLYVSTACQHDHHKECRVVCKFCQARCRCRKCVHDARGDAKTVAG